MPSLVSHGSRWIFWLFFNFTGVWGFIIHFYWSWMIHSIFFEPCKVFPHSHRSFFCKYFLCRDPVCGVIVLSYVTTWCAKPGYLSYIGEPCVVVPPCGLLWCTSLFWSKRLRIGRGPELADKPSEERNLTNRLRGDRKYSMHTLKSTEREGMARGNCVAMKGILPCIGCVGIVEYQAG